MVPFHRNFAAADLLAGLVPGGCEDNRSLPRGRGLRDRRYVLLDHSARPINPSLAGFRPSENHAEEQRSQSPPSIGTAEGKIPARAPCSTPTATRAERRPSGITTASFPFLSNRKYGMIFFRPEGPRPKAPPDGNPRNGGPRPGWRLKTSSSTSVSPPDRRRPYSLDHDRRFPGRQQPR